MKPARLAVVGAIIALLASSVVAAARAAVDSKPDELREIFSAYLAKRALVTHTRPAIVICDSALAAAVTPASKRLLLPAFATSISAFTGCARTPKSAPSKDSLVVYVGKISERNDMLILNATGETPGSLWGETATMVLRPGPRFLKSLEFSDWLMD